MSSIFAASGLGRRSRSIASSSHDHTDSSASSRRRSSSSKSHNASRSSSQLDDWSDGFTGIVDLDRRMRELAMTEQGLSNAADGDSSNIYEPYFPPAAPWTEQQQRQSSRNSSSNTRHNSDSHSSMATGRSSSSWSPNPNAPSCSSTAASSRFSQDSRAHSSLLSKRRSSSANTGVSTDDVHSLLRLAPLPAASSAFGSYRLTDANDSPASRSARPSSTFSPLSWSSVEEQDPLTPLAARRQTEALTPGTAAAATWTDPTAPSYFPAGLSGSSSKKTRSLRRKAARAPLPRLVSGEVVSSPMAEPVESRFPLSPLSPGQNEGRGASESTHTHGDHDESGASSALNTHSLKRSAQSLALSLRFKLIRAKRKVKRTQEGASELFGTRGSSQRSSIEATLST